MGADHGGERAAQHEPFQRQAHDSRPFRYDAAARREEIRIAMRIICVRNETGFTRRSFCARSAAHAGLQART